MRRRVLSSLIALLMLLVMVPMHSYAEDTVITTAAIAGVTAPVKGATPVTTITETAEYTGTVTWSGTPSTFAADTQYTATITITPKTGYTLTGVTANFFTVAGAAATNEAGLGVVTAVFPKTEPDVVPDKAISTAAIAGVTAPVKGAAPVSAITGTAEYTGTVVWSGTPVTFGADTEYTATITITPQSGYTLTGIAANFFTVAGAAATNEAGSGVITAVFPKTQPEAPHLVSAATNSTGDTVTMIFDKAMSDPSADAGSFIVKINGYSYSYKTSALITVSNASLSPNSAMIDLALATPLQRGDIVTVDYIPGTVMSTDNIKLEAFSSQPVMNMVPVVISTNLAGIWEIFDHVGNWGEVPFPTGDDPRGSEYNRHIVISGSKVIFYGNGIQPFKDFLYLPSTQAAAKSFAFDLDLSGIKYHSMEGGGFLFNTVIEGGKISGYCVLFINNYGNYAVDLYQIDNVDVNNFHDGLGNYYNLGANPAGITKLGTFPLPAGDQHTIRLESSSSTVDMWDGTTKLIDNVTLPVEYSNGVGVIGSYQRHSCSELSYFIFSNLNIQGIADLAAALTGNQVNLTFTAPEGATAVVLEQSTDAGTTWTPASTSQLNDTSTSAMVTGLAANHTYYFRLQITGGKYGGYSRVATVDYKEDPGTIPVETPSSVSHVHYKLTINKTGEGTVLPETGDHMYNEISTVNLYPTPAHGYTFEGWIGTTGNSVLVDKDITVTAVFKKITAEPTPIPTPTPTPAPVSASTPVPAPEPEATPTPAPVPETVIGEEPSQDAPAALPKTGGVPAAMICGLGGLITAAGLYLRKKK